MRLALLFSVFLIASASCGKPASCGSCAPDLSCAGSECQPPAGDGFMSADLAVLAYDVGTQPGAVFAVPGPFGGTRPTPSAICHQLGADFKSPTSAAGIDMAKLAQVGGWYFADVPGSFNEASQLVDCGNVYSEPVLFGGGANKPTGVKKAQPAPCGGFSAFYACDSGFVACGAGPKLETTNGDGEGVGVLCAK